MSSPFPFPTRYLDEVIAPSAVHPTEFYSLTDPALDADNHVQAGKRWRKTDDLLTPTWFEVYVRNEGNDGWILERAWVNDTYAVGEVPVADANGRLAPGTVSGGSTVDIEDEGSPEGAADTIDFVGAGVDVSYSGGKATVTIPGGGSGVDLEDEGTPLGTFDTVDFTGSGVTVTDDGGGHATVAVSGGGSLPDWLDDNPDAQPASPGSHDDEGDGAASWSWRNQGGASITSTKGTLVLTAPVAASDSWRIREQAITGNVDIIAKVAVGGHCDAGNHQAGVGFLVSGSGAFIYVGRFIGAAQYTLVQKWTNVTTFSANAKLVTADLAGNLSWLYCRCVYDGTNVAFYVSGNGIGWTLMFAETAATFLGGAPDRFILAVNNQHSGGVDTTGVFDFVRDKDY